MATCIKNIPIFDPDTVYLYSKPLIEIDYLLKCNDNEADEKCPLKPLCQLLNKLPDNKSDYLIIEAEKEMDRIIDKQIRRSSLSATYIPNTIFLNEKNQQEIKSIDSYCNCQEPQKRDWLYWLYGELMNTLFLGTALLPQPLLNSWTGITNENNSLGDVRSPTYTIMKLQYQDNKQLTLEPLETIITVLRERPEKSEFNRWIRNKYNEIVSLCPNNDEYNKISIVVLIQSGLGAFRLAKIYSSIQTITDLFWDKDRGICYKLKNRQIDYNMDIRFIFSGTAYEKLKNEVDNLLTEISQSLSKLDEQSKKFVEKIVGLIRDAEPKGNPSPTKITVYNNTITIDIYLTDDIDFGRYLKQGNTIFVITSDYHKPSIKKLITTIRSHKSGESEDKASVYSKILIINESFYIPKDSKTYRVTTRDSYFYKIITGDNKSKKHKDILSGNKDFLNELDNYISNLPRLEPCMNLDNQDSIINCENRLGLALLLFKSVLLRP